DRYQSGCRQVMADYKRCRQRWVQLKADLKKAEWDGLIGYSDHNHQQESEAHKQPPK
ncbi:hypothetical protein HK100_005374, partial [Physocladia obscura]